MRNKVLNFFKFFWVMAIDNKIADNEMRVMYGWEPDEGEKE